MTTRQRQAPGSAATTVAHSADLASDRLASFSWADWFRHASPQQRADALGLAQQQQGVLYPHQLPPTNNGVRPSAAKVDAEASPVISRLLAGKTDSLPPIPHETLTFFDSQLDDLQRQAVARAIGTPDLFLLQGLPGTGKSRVLTEILLQAATRGWRTLFLAGQSCSLDVILHRLVGRPEVFPLRFLDALEKPESLPPWLRGFTLDEQKQSFLERTLAGARSNHAQAESTCRQRHDETPLWAELQSCAERHRDLAGQLQALREQMPSVAADVERGANSATGESAFTTRLAELRKSQDDATCELEVQLRTQREAAANCEQEISTLSARLAALAKKSSHFWTIGYWTNLFNGAMTQEIKALQEQDAKAQATKQAIAEQIEQITEKRNRRLEQFNQERAAIIASEIQARKQALDQKQQSLDAESQRLDEHWTALCQRLDVCPVAKTADAIDATYQAWLHKKQNDEQQCQFAQQWTKYVEDAGTQLAAKLPSFANLLAGTIMRWHTDAKFKDAIGGPVDLLIVEDAETLTEADLLKLSRQAQRCVLIGQSLAEPTPAPTVAEKASRALLAAPLVSAVCWHRLWQTLGGDAGRWPCSWQREQGRLVCQLLPLTAEDRQQLESESLADAPDIELRILHRPRTRPGLAEVIFASHCSFEDAFAFMVREVQEFPLEPLGRTGWWSEDGERFCRHLGPNAVGIHAWLPIEPGLRLGTVADEHGDATRVASIEFDKTAGWDRAKADAWLYRHRPVCDHERTVFLQTPYRFERPMARIVQSMVRCSDWLISGLPEHGAPAFEFVAVPPLAKHEWPREGAGLELDLSASRHADRLPVGLRQGLPGRGFVNYLEAQALVRRLEVWVRKDATASSHAAVLALYEGQVELLRRLIEQSEILRARTCEIEVALPTRLHQRECDVVFLSMTRSHAHRCVAFGEDVKELPLALTRPRSRLFVFGDAGSLCKRTSWHGPLDQLDAPSAQQELLRLSRLVAYLKKHGHALPPTNGQTHARA